MGDTNNNSLSVTNNTNNPISPGNLPNAAITLDVYAPSPAPNQVYDLPITTLKTSAGGSTIGVGETASVLLDPARMDYDLVFARPADLFPLQNTVVNDILSVAAVSIDAPSPAQLALALNFVINLQVYPTSNVAKQYFAAVSDASTTGSLTAVTAFFQSTTDYKTLTLSSVVTAQRYASSFAYLWAGFTPNFASFNSSITYYLYSTGTAPAGASQSNQAPPVYQGSLSMTKSASAPNPADPADRTGAYTITFNPPKGASRPLLFLDGQFVSDSTDSPSIALQGSFILKSFLTNEPSDNTIVPILVGTVNGVQVLGTTTKQDQSRGSDLLGDSGPSVGSGFFTFFYPTTFAGIVQLLGGTLGLWMAFEWVGEKWKRRRGKPSEIEKMQKEMDEFSDRVQKNQQKILDKLDNPDARVPAQRDVLDAQVAGRGKLVDLHNLARSNAQLDILQQQYEQLKVAAQYGVNKSMEELAEGLRTTARNLSAAQGFPPPPFEGEALQNAVNNAATGIRENQTNLDEVLERAQASLNATDQANIKTSEEAQMKAQERAETAENAANEARDGKGGQEVDVVE